jgi:hypothetical protein
MGRFAGLGLGICALALGAALGSSACSSGSDNKPSASAAGGSAITAGNAGASGASAAQGGAAALGGGANQAGSANPSGGTAGGTVLVGDSKTEACIAYAIAACTRAELCSSRTSTDCLVQSFACPDLVFSDGSTRTVASVKACAEQINTFPCDKIVAGYLPDCVSPGTRMGGESCSFASQCASLECDSPNHGSCGTCKAPVVSGGACSPDVACAPGLRCGASATCEVAPPDPDVPAGEGEPCGPGPQCFVELYCSATKICTKEPTLGASCKDSHLCPSGSYCATDTFKCTASPPVGSACASDGDETGYCTNAYCLANVCTALPALGAPCMVDPTTSQPEEFSCTDGGHCDTSLATPVCVASGAPGATCVADGDCNAGLRCLCTDLSHCPAPICIQLRYAGESCGAPGMVCHPGFSCTNGNCQPRDSQGTFAACPG